MLSDWRILLLNQIDAPVTDANLQFLSNWNKQEGNLSGKSGLGINNPLNTTLDFGGGASVNSVGVKFYPDLQTGVDAIAQTLKNGASTYSYQNVIDALKTGDPFTYQGDLATPLKHWSGNGYSSILGQTTTDTGGVPTVTANPTPGAPPASSGTSCTPPTAEPGIGPGNAVPNPQYYAQEAQYILCILLEDAKRAAFIIAGVIGIIVGLWLLTRADDAPGHDVNVAVTDKAQDAAKVAGAAAVAA